MQSTPQLHSFQFLDKNFYLSTLLCTALIIFYPFERINLIGVLFCYFTCSIILYSLIKRLSTKHQGISINWFYVFQIKLTVSLVLAAFFLFLPLGKDVSTTQQYPPLIDATFYNYLAKVLAHDGILNNIDLAYSGWQTGGIAIVTGIIYTVFSSSTLTIIIVNSLLITFSCLLIFILAKSIFKTQNVQTFFFLLPFLPMESSYDIVPSKEVFSVFFIVSLLYLTFLLVKKQNILNWVLVLICCFLLFLMRFNLLVSLFFYAILFLFFFRASVKKILLSLGLTSLVVFLSLSVGSVGNIVFRYLDFGIINAMIDIKDTNNGLKKIIIDTFAATSLPKMIGFLPIRALIFLFLPFPILLFAPSYINDLIQLKSIHTDSYFWFHFYIEGSAKLDAFFMLIAFPFFILFLSQLKQNIQDSYGYFFLFFFVFMLLSLSTFNFVEGTRYRALIEPLYYAMVFVSIKKKFSPTLKYFSIAWYVTIFLLPTLVWVTQLL